jgi:hypothetical protein
MLMNLRLLLCFLAILGPGTYYLFREVDRAVTAAPFTPYLDEYLQMPGRLPSNQERPPGQGGFLPINLDTRAVDELYLSLPSWMRAKQPDDVKTLVWLRWKVQDVRLSRSRVGSQQVCHVTVIDRASNLIVGETTCTGLKPFRSGFQGPKPTSEIIAYLYSFQAPKARPPKG